MFNPLDFVTERDIIELGLTPNDLTMSYQPSTGGVFHIRGAEGKGKTLWGAHYYRYCIDNNLVLPANGVGNLEIKGKYGDGWTVLKGQKLHEYLWNLTHVPYRNKFIFIDEIDSEFPARFFSSREQTEIAIRLWHTHKLGNRVIMTSHKGNSTDVIFHLASHYVILPDTPNFETNSLDFTFIDNLKLRYSEQTAHDIIKTMLIYNRQELTEETNEQLSYADVTKKSKKKSTSVDMEVDLEQSMNFENELTEFL